MKISSRPPSTDSLRICQTGEGNSFYPPLHGIILAIFENAKNGRKKTGNLFLISCLGVPFLCSGGYSVFNWLQFYKLEVNLLLSSKKSLLIMLFFLPFFSCFLSCYKQINSNNPIQTLITHLRLKTEYLVFQNDFP